MVGIYHPTKNAMPAASSSHDNMISISCAHMIYTQKQIYLWVSCKIFYWRELQYERIPANGGEFGNNWWEDLRYLTWPDSYLMIWAFFDICVRFIIHFYTDLNVIFHWRGWSSSGRSASPWTPPPPWSSSHAVFTRFFRRFWKNDEQNNNRRRRQQPHKKQNHKQQTKQTESCQPPK